MNVKKSGVNNFFSRTKKTRDDWETPRRLFNILDDMFGPFTLDAASSHSNYLCPKYFTREDNGLVKSWKGHTVFLNPPFAKMSVWVRKAYREGLQLSTKVIMIMPARTDTAYWHDYVMKARSIGFCRGRVNFLIGGRKPKAGSTFPTVVVEFDNHDQEVPTIYSLIHKFVSGSTQVQLNFDFDKD